MKQISICDMTLSRASGEATPLTFRKKLDIAAFLDKMQVSVVELGEAAQTMEEKLLIKSVASSLGESKLSVSVGFDEKNVDFVWEALKTAKHPRLQVSASLSTSRMEYVYHKKAKDMIPLITAAVAKCHACGAEVEFCADDATRADSDFLVEALEAAIAAGADVVTVCDTSGKMLPFEFGAFLSDLLTRVKGISNVTLGVRCNRDLELAEAMAVEAIRSGAGEIKASAGPSDTASLSGLVKILYAKAEYLDVCSKVGFENFSHYEKMIEALCTLSAAPGTPFENRIGEPSGSLFFTEADTKETIDREIDRLGYVLSEIDREHIFAAFRQIIAKKKQIDLHELEVIVASESMQVPQTYKLNSFVVTTGNAVDTVAHIKLERDGKFLDGVSLGNGSVDAAFLAIEKILGCHYELDDFQIQAITEGKEAMGQTLVKLRSSGKVYSGQGVSTDIVTSAVNAYINALNKIVYEEKSL